VCQECAQLSLGVPGLCLGEAGVGAGKRCKCLIIKPLEPATNGLKIRVSVVRFRPWHHESYYFPTNCNRAVH